MIFALSSGSFTIESNVSRQSFSVKPHDWVMLFRPWHFVHSCATTSLPGPSGRSAAPPFLWPAAGAIVHMKMAAAASIPSEIFDMSPPQEAHLAEGVTLLPRIIQETGFQVEYPRHSRFHLHFSPLSGGDLTCMRRETGSRRRFSWLAGLRRHWPSRHNRPIP